MSTNQNTTRESSKRCSRRVISIIALVIVSVFALAIPCSALTVNTGDNDYLYPTFMTSGYYWLDSNIENAYGFSLELGTDGSEVFTYSNTFFTPDIFMDVENTDGRVTVYWGDTESLGYSEYRVFDTFAHDFKMYELYSSLGEREPLPLYYLYLTDNRTDNIIIPYNIIYDVTFYGVNANGISSGLDYEPLVLRFQLDGLSTSSQGGSLGLHLPSISDVLPLLYDFYLDTYGEGVHFQYSYDELSEHDYVTYLYDSEGNKILLDFKDILSIVNWQSAIIFPDNRPNVIEFECGITEDTIIDAEQEDAAEIYYEGVLGMKFESSNAGTIVDAIIDTEYPNTRLLSWLGSAVRGFLSVEIFPNFSLGAILGVVTMIPIVIWLLKLIAGG